ncbi:MAG: beta-lactamase family protein [SAR202 cluster bacterium]|nr:beta-lactamase family protein [SAR202 cluster bacterium]
MASHCNPFPPASPKDVGLSEYQVTRLARIVRGYVDDGDIVGAKVLLVKDGRTVLHEAAGWKDREAGKPMAAGTLFNIRSMTKPIGGMVIQMLIDDGVLGLHDPIGKHLPHFNNPRSGKITIEHLLTHRSGFRQYRVPRMPLHSLGEIADHIGEVGPDYQRGIFHYSDIGADFLGALIEAVTGASLSEVFHRRVFVPLGMADTYTLDTATPAFLARTASAYELRQGQWQRKWDPTMGPNLPYPMAPPFTPMSQGIFTSPADYARFVSVWLNGGVFGGRRLISEAAIGRALSTAPDAGEPGGFPGMTWRYGQMWWLAGRPGQTGMPFAFRHGGSDGTWAWGWPAHRMMALYFTQSRGEVMYSELESALSDLFPEEEFGAGNPSS